MGCDIHVVAQKRVNGKWTTIDGLTPFDWRSYGMFGFPADVRNYSAVPPIVSTRRGLPSDIGTLEDSEFFDDLHSCMWLSVEELLAFDYDKEMEDRRCARRDPSGIMNHGSTCEPGQGKRTTFRKFLGDAFFEDLEKLRAAGAERVVFGFDG